MLAKLTSRIEGVALRTAPAGAARVMGALPHGALTTLQRSRFRHTLRLVAERSPFYREQFRRRGIRADRIGHPSELGDFYTTGEDLRVHGSDAFLIGRPDTAFETTGTTSPLPKRVFFSNRELNTMGSASAAALHLLGLRQEDRVLSAFDCSFWVSPAVARSALQYVGCFHVEAGKIDPLECYLRAVSYRPTVILGEPSWLCRFAEIAAERGTWPIKFIVGGGENLSDEMRRAIERVWKAPCYLNYGQTEAFGSLGLECSEQKGYHRNDLHFLFEIDGADADGYGELIYTTLTRDVMPLIRYRSSDVTRLVDTPCECGLFAGRIAKLLGRSDEMVVCGMGNVGPWVFDELLRGIPGAGHEWQCVVSHNGRYDALDLRVEYNGAVDGSRLEPAVLENLRDRFPDFWKNRAMNLYELRIGSTPPGSLRPGRKLRRIVDKRSLLHAKRDQSEEAVAELL